MAGDCRQRSLANCEKNGPRTPILIKHFEFTIMNVALASGGKPYRVEDGIVLNLEKRQSNDSPPLNQKIKRLQ